MKTTILALAVFVTVPAAAAPRKGDAAVETNPEAQAQVRKRLDEIWATFVSKDVYDDTAISTFNGDFSGKIDGHPVAEKQATTIVCVKYKGDWKIVHEHFSPLGPPGPESVPPHSKS